MCAQNAVRESTVADAADCAEIADKGVTPFPWCNSDVRPGAGWRPS